MAINGLKYCAAPAFHPFLLAAPLPPQQWPPLLLPNSLLSYSPIEEQMQLENPYSR